MLLHEQSWKHSRVIQKAAYIYSQLGVVGVGRETASREESVQMDQMVMSPTIQHTYIFLPLNLGTLDGQSLQTLTKCISLIKSLSLTGCKSGTPKWQICENKLPMTKEQ